MNLTTLPSPCFVIQKQRLIQNLEQFEQVAKQTGIKVLHAQKAFATYCLYPLMARYLDGVCASGLYEATLAHQEFDGEIHTYSPAYRDDEIALIMEMSHTVVFNSVEQLAFFGDVISRNPTTTSIGIRVNPACSVTTTALYDPCRPGSRLGVLAEQASTLDWSIIDGIHFHALCEQDSYALEKVLLQVERDFATYLPQIGWLNMGGGHYLPHETYDTDHFVTTINAFGKRHPHLQLYMEPGGAVALNAGLLCTTVLDVIERSGVQIAILDVSCSCHTPDVLEMPYRPRVDTEVPLETAPHVYELGGVSCLAGDVFGTYGFETPLKRGSQVTFLDMAQYSIVKTNMFNGVRHPAIALWDEASDTTTVINEFSFDDFKRRM